MSLALISTVVVLSFSSAITKTTANAGKAIKGQAVKAACGLAAELGTVQSRALHVMHTTARAVGSAAQQTLKTMIYIEKVKAGQYKPVDSALLAHYMEIANKAVEDMQGQRAADLATAIADAAREEGAIQDYLGYVAQIAATATHTCIQDPSSNTDKTGSSESDLKLTYPGCKAREGSIEPNAAKTTKFTDKGYTDSAFNTKSSATHTGGSSECSLTNNKAASNKLLDASTNTATIAGTPRPMGGLFEHAADMQSIATVDLQASREAQALLKATVTAATTANQDPPTFAFSHTDSLKADRDFQRQYRRHVLNDRALDQTSPPNLEQDIAAALGTKEDMEKEYHSNFDTTMVVNLVAKSPAEKALSSIDSLSELTAIFIYYRQLNHKNLKDKITQLEEKLKQSSKSSGTTTEQICNAIGDKNETGCKNTSGCHFVSTNPDGTKCTLNPAAAKAAKEAANQETGKDGEKEDKCSHKKKEGECTGNCKWDGKECKDSSFLLNKQFALTVVSAAFVSLLF